jgi:hypothetical protein
MGFTLFVNFTGLCLFVPHPTGKRMRVLLVDVTNPHGNGHGNGAGPGHHHDHGDNSDASRRHEAHFPVLVYDDRDLAVPREDDRKFFQGDKFGRMKLQDFDLEIAGARQDALSLLDSRIGNCPTNGSARNASWMADIGTVGQRNGAVDPNCLVPNNVSPAVGARMRLTDGELSTRFIAANNGRRPVQYRFGPEGGTLLDGSRAIAEVMELKLEIPGDTVTLDAKSFRVAGKTDRIVLKPQLPGADARIFIKNMPDLDIEGTRPADPVGTLNERRNVDFHFAHFDRLLLQPATAGQEPLPLPGDSCNYIQAEPPYLGNPQCPIIGSNPNPGA